MAEIIDYEKKARDELSELQQQECNISKLRAEISKLKLSEKTTKKETITKKQKPTVVEVQQEDETFEDEVNYYLDNYHLQKKK